MKKKKVLLVATMMIVCASGVIGCGKKEMADTAGEVVAETPTELVTEEPEEVTLSTEQAEVTEQAEAAESMEQSGQSVKEMSVVKYAKSAVNVRSGAGTEYDKLGGLSANEKVTVTGQADNGWYRIDYNGASGFVSDKYLQDQMTAVAKPENGRGSNISAGTQAGTQNNAAGGNGTGNTGNAQQTPSTPAPAPQQPAPSAPAPAPQQPAPSAPAPAPQQPAPSAPAPAPQQPAPSAPAPAPQQPAPSAPAPAPTPSTPDAGNNGGYDMALPEGVEPPNAGNTFIGNGDAATGGLGGSWD